MKSNDVPPELVVRYQDLLNLLARTLKYLEGLNHDPALLNSYRQLLRYLRTRPEKSIPELLGNARECTEAVAERSNQQLSDQEIRTMTFEKIISLTEDTSTPRRDLERIASVRFSVTKGGLSTLRTKDALIQKLRNLIGNETAHESINRVAGKQWTER